MRKTPLFLKLITIIFGIFLFLNSAQETQAATYQQLDASTESNDISSNDAYQQLGTGLSGQLESITFKARKITGGPDVNLAAWVLCFTDASYTLICDINEWGTNDQLVNCDGWPVCATAITETATDYSFTFNSEPARTFLPSRYYIIQLRQTNGQLYRTFGSSNPASYTGGQLRGCSETEYNGLCTTGPFDPSQHGDLYFIVETQADNITLVDIDIKPGSDPNSINLGSGGNVPVAIFGTITFDVTQIDPDSVTLANASIKLKGNGQAMADYKDVNGDSITDIVVHFTTEALELTETYIQAELNGFLFDGQNIKGTDSVRIVQ